MGKSSTLGSGKGPSRNRTPGMTTMEEILEKQADSIGDEVVSKMDEILDEMPEYVALKRDEDLLGIDKEVLKLTKLTTEVVHELMWSLGRPGAVSDITLITQIEDATEMLSDVLDSLPEIEEEPIEQDNEESE
tara:strand:- start:161 stop:559 length:399 start_codon:yes stop_codon:yes gene_type:complete